MRNPQARVRAAVAAKAPKTQLPKAKAVALSKKLLAMLAAKSGEWRGTTVCRRVHYLRPGKNIRVHGKRSIAGASTGRPGRERSMQRK